MTDLQKIVKYKISCKSVQWGPSCFVQADRQMDKHVKLTVAVLRMHLKTKWTTYSFHPSYTYWHKYLPGHQKTFHFWMTHLKLYAVKQSGIACITYQYNRNITQHI